MKNTIYVLAVIALTFTACKNEQKTDGHNDESSTEIHADSDGHNDNKKEVTHDNSDGHHDNDGNKSMGENRNIEDSSDKNTATTPIIDAYLQIKNGLVADDKAAAAKGGEALLQAFAGFDMGSLTKEQHTEYMEIIENAKEQAEHIIKSPIDHQREHFESLSTDINDMISLLGTEKTLYVDHCPMVKANWLSETKEIKNPYYGSKMMKCGKIQQQIN